MDSCIFSERLMAYYDGELPPEKRTEMESHLRDCAACAAELADYRAVSRLLNEEQVPTAPEGMIDRMHKKVRPVREYEIQRTCRWAAAIAAALLMGCIGWLARWEAFSNGNVESPALWEVAAVTFDPEVPDSESDNIAHFMANDLARGSSR